MRVQYGFCATCWIMSVDLDMTMSRTLTWRKVRSWKGFSLFPVAMGLLSASSQSTAHCMCCSYLPPHRRGWVSICRKFSEHWTVYLGYFSYVTAAMEKNVNCTGAQSDSSSWFGAKLSTYTAVYSYAEIMLRCLGLFRFVFLSFFLTNCCFYWFVTVVVLMATFYR